MKHRVSADDCYQIAHNIDDHIFGHKMCQEFCLDDLKKILGMVQLDIKQAITLFSDGKQIFRTHQAFRIFQHTKVNFGEDYKTILEFIKVLHKSLKSPILKSIYKTFKDLSNDSISKSSEINNLKSQIDELQKQNEMYKQHIEELKKIIENIDPKLIPADPEISEPSKPQKISKFVEQLKNYKPTPEDFKQIYSILDQSVKEDDNDAIKYAIDNGFDKVALNGSNLLLTAASENNFELAKAIAENGADIFAKSESGATVLHYFARDGNLPALKYFCNIKGIDLNSRNKTDNTPLHFAAWNNKLEAVEYLASFPEVDINAKNKEGKSPFKYTRSEEIKLFLRSKGCID